MTVSTGDRIGPYEITGDIGSGGMGDVKQALDTRLNRCVAIKLLKIAHTDRFEREARAIAAVNHPHICALYDVGVHDGAPFLVMEHIDGEPLQGRLPIERTLTYAAQIADALDAAHRKGIVHRDLKPANVLVTRSGIKLLDFGIAKVRRATADVGDTETLDVTRPGTIVGTPQYMAPEQLEGKEADVRSDIFAFGCLFYKMLTGRPAFDGKNPAAVAAQILSSEPPPLRQLQPHAPLALELLVCTCLAKDPEERWQSAHDVRRAISLIQQQATDQKPVVPRARFVWLALSCLCTAAIFAAWLAFRNKVPELPTVRFTIDPPPETTLVMAGITTAVSPDGRHVILSAQSGSDKPFLWLHSLDSINARRLSGTEEARYPFWSPDSKSIGFFSGGKLKRIEISGGIPVVLCEASISGATVGGTWNRKGTIVFGGVEGLRSVPASGGDVTSLTRVDASRQEAAHGFPEFLPDGERILYFLESANPDLQGTYISSLTHPEKRLRIVASVGRALVAGPRGSDPEYLLWIRARTLLTQRFNMRELRLEGEAVPLSDDSISHPGGFSASGTGVLAYTQQQGKTRLTWIGRDGRNLGYVGLDDQYTSLRLSPDDGSIAVTIGTPPDDDVWLFHLARGLLTRFTFGPESEGLPVWSPDGRQIAFTSNRTGVFQIYRKDVDGGDEETQITEDLNSKWTTDWHRDLKHVLYFEFAPKTHGDLTAVLVDTRKPVSVVATAFNASAGKFSPDGRWLAYMSDESGRYEVYTQSFPASRGKRQMGARHRSG